MHPLLGWVHNNNAGTMNIVSVVSVKGKMSNSISDVKFSDNLIDWTLANARNATLELKSSLFQRHPDAHDAMLVRASYCEPAFNCIIMWVAMCSMMKMASTMVAH